MAEGGRSNSITVASDLSLQFGHLGPWMSSERLVYRRHHPSAQEVPLQVTQRLGMVLDFQGLHCCQLVPGAPPTTKEPSVFWSVKRGAFGRREVVCFGSSGELLVALRHGYFLHGLP